MIHQKPLTSVLIKPSGPDCNLGCQYCFYTGKAALFGPGTRHRMSRNLLETTIRQVMEQSPEHIAFSWQGGEPSLMGLPFFEVAVRLERQYGDGKLVGNAFQTNGLLIDDRWARFFCDNQFLVGLSLDGPEHVHDRYRRKTNGSPSWARVMYGVEWMWKYGVAVNSVSTVTRYSAEHVDEVYDFLKQTGFRYMQFVPVVEESDGTARLADYSVLPDQYGEFLVSLFGRWLEDFTPEGPTTFVRFFDAVFNKYAGLEPAECEMKQSCGTYVVIEHNGDVYPCDFFVAPEWRLGSLRDDTLVGMLNSPKQDAFGSAKAHLPTACLSCAWLKYCQGGCPKDRLRNPARNGTSYFCESYKRFFERADRQLRELACRWKQAGN